MKHMRILFLALFLGLIGACVEAQVKPEIQFKPETQLELDNLENNAAKICPTCAESSKFNPECRIVVAPCTRSKISEIDKALDDAFATGKPVVLYIHGRGNEPKKTLNERILKTLEADYSVKVLMLNWDSKVVNPLHRPVKEAHESGPHLQEVITRLVEYRKSHPEIKAVNVSLLAHSMGNLVLRKALENLDLSSASEPLFTNILMTGSDEDAENHNLWIEKLSARETILITINEQDSILRRSNHPDGKTPLGLNPKPPLAANAYYLDATGLVGGTHRLFTKGKQHSRIAICEILTAMLHGEKPILEIGKTIQRIEHNRILVPIAEQNKADRCFHGVTDESNLEEELE